MKVSDLYPANPIRGNDCYIIGSGPSLTLFDPAYFNGRICVLLNDTHRYFKAGPIAFSNSKKFLNDCSLPIQVVKGRQRRDPNPEQPDNHVSWDHPTRYVFSYREPPWDSYSHNTPDALWREPDYYYAAHEGCSAHFAIQFAVLCGAKSIQLVGCDCCEFQDREYVETKRPKQKLKHNYAQYAAGEVVLFRQCRERGVPIFTLSPFAGFGREQSQYSEMIKWK